jgi:hypothetical protein
MECFACAAAWHFQLGSSNDDRDGYSFGLLASAPPTLIRKQVARVSSSPQYGELRRQRHRAGHRGILFEKRIYSVEKGFRLGTVDREDAQAVLGRVFRWGQNGVRALQDTASSQGWPGATHDETYLLSRWPPLDSQGSAPGGV